MGSLSEASIEAYNDYFGTDYACWGEVPRRELIANLIALLLEMGEHG